MTHSPVLLIGATGMLGRPVARRLVQDGYSVRALVRDPARARAILPPQVELVRGNIEDIATLVHALQGVAAVYINLACPFRKKPPAWSLERDGTSTVVNFARECGVRRILRISAMGVQESADETHWWCAQHKADADRAVMESGLQWTIFQPTWFMESLATMRLGPFALSIDLRSAKLRWLAGDDYARQVSAAIDSETARERTYYPQGPEPLTIPEAVKRFTQALPDTPRTIGLPRWLFTLTSQFSGQANYMHHLLRMTTDHFARLDRTPFPTNLPAATMTIEDYVQYMRETGDRPSKA